MDRLISNQNDLARWVAQAQPWVDLAVAFWGDGAIEFLGLDQPGRKFRVLLDLTSGATNPKVARRLLEIAPSRVRCVRRLHTKMYLSATEVIVGSANASANGLGIEGNESTQWHELSLLSNDANAVASASSWFSTQWKRSEKIDEARLKEAQQNWIANRQRRPLAPNDGRTLIAAALANPGAYKDRGWFVAIDLDPLDDPDQQHLEALERDLGRPVFAWTDWPKIPPHARLICFTRFDQKRFRRDVLPGSPDGVYYSADHPRSRFKFVTGSHIPGFQGKIGALKEWLPLLLEAEYRHATWIADRGLCMDLGEFVTRFGRSTLSRFND